MQKMFRQQTTLNPVQMRSLEKEQKKLQEALNDRNLKLRYNRRHNFCQVWYFPRNSAPYIVLNIKDNYNLCWAIHTLKARQRKGRELAEMAIRHFEAHEKKFEEDNYGLSREMGELLDDRRKGKIVTSARTIEE